MSNVIQLAASPASIVAGLFAGGARSGRIPLPEAVVSLTPSDEPALLHANMFVDDLAALTREQWRTVGRQLVENRETLPLRSTSWAIMDATIGHHRLGLAAWNVRDAVETIFFLATQTAGRPSRADRRLLAAAHAAAEDAALAVLARDYLPARDFAVLCAPFTPFSGVTNGAHSSVD